MVSLETIMNIPNYIDLEGQILPLLIYALIIGIYGIFVLYFYKSISKRNLFKFKVERNSRAAAVTKYLLKYIIIFPLLTFIWFSVLTVIMFFLSKSQSTSTILLLSMAVIAASRIAAYIREDAAMEIAKILPLAVLGVFLVDPTYFSLGTTTARIYEIPTLGVLLLNYILFAIILEFGLRLIYEIKKKIKGQIE